MNDATIAGLFGIVAALIAASSAITAALLTRNYKQGQEIHVMVNGELSRTRHQVEILTKKLEVYQELGLVAALAQEESQAPSGEVRADAPEYHPDQ